MLFHICFKDSVPNSFVGDYRSIEECVASPMVTMGLGVNYVSKLAALLEFGFELQSVAGLVRAVNHHNAVGGGNEAVITASNLVFHKNIFSKLLHGAHLRWTKCC